MMKDENIIIAELIGNIIRFKNKFGDEETIEKFEQKILDLNNYKISYLFARDIKGADIKSHGHIVIDSNNIGFNYIFARDVEGADIKAHGQVIIDSKDTRFNELFARDIKGADVEGHNKVIMGNKNSENNTIKNNNVNLEKRINQKILELNRIKNI